jgi:2,4-dienoyl-CoA reductase (NADPH2)
MGLNRWLGCIENPRTGRESVVVPVRSRGKRVIVVGGGPAGLQAAVTATERSHQVSLYERSQTLGGQIPAAASVPSRAELLDITRNLVAEARRLSVDVRTGVLADEALIRAAQPSAVVLATGARPSRPWWAGSSERVVDVRQVLEGAALPQGRVLVFDELGFHQATSVAELVAERGGQLTVATNAMVVGQDLGITLDLETWNMRAHALGIQQATDLVPMEVAAHDGGVAVRLQHHPTGQDRMFECDWVVACTHQEPEDALWQALKGAPFPVFRIGDCLAPRRAHAAVVEGYRVAVSL